MRGSRLISERKDILKRAKRIFFVSKYIKNQFFTGSKYSKQENEKLIVLYNGITRNIKSFPKKKKKFCLLEELLKKKERICMLMLDFLARSFLIGNL